MAANISANRRRLSVGTCEAVSQNHTESDSNVNRGLLVQLNEQSWQNTIAESSGGVRLSFSSNTDAALKRHVSYEEKDTVMEGGSSTIAKDLLKSLGVGIVCKKGLKPESPNQDSFSFHYAAESFSLYGVFDGHGPAGHEVSQFVKEILPKLFLQHSKRENNPEEALREAFIKCQELIVMQTAEKKMDATMSGTTVTVVYRPHHDNFFVVAHTGDSRAILASANGVTKELTVDHKPNLPKERERIEARGGRVVFDGFYNYRVFAKGGMYPGLNMSRALGDTVAHRVAGLTEVPDVTRFELNRAQDKALIICTDGVWEFVESKEAASIVLSYKVSESAEAAENLAQQSWDRWMRDSEGEVSDDITAMVIAL